MNKLFNFDKKNRNSEYLIGTDEAGRGPLAGPVVAAAVCFPNVTKELAKSLELINDSKQLSENNREYLFNIIKANSINSITVIDVEEIEKENILRCSLKAMKVSCENIIKQIKENAEIFVDGNRKIPNFKYLQRTIVKGDGKSASIAAASILAKVYRDRIMKKYALEYPEYDFVNNKGYGTPKHIEAILKYGTTPIHRQSFLKKIFERENEKQLTLNF
ncbi:MAG: ribonuclease HII [bacterium]|nr:ribonuclease HII [bacterium]